MDEKEFEALKAKLGEEATNKIKKELENYKAVVAEMIKGEATEEKIKQARADMEGAVKDIREIVEKQGTTITELLLHMANKGGNSKSQFKSIAQTLYEDRKELAEIYRSRSRNKTYMIVSDSNGNPVMKEFDETGFSNKAAGPHATIDDVISGDNVASITQSLDAATLLRLGGGSEIHSVYRNTPWIFDLANTYTVGFGQSMFMYYNELAKDGGSNQVAEGGTKPAAQYKFELKSETYKKEAVLVGFTEEFLIDFERLQNEIMNKVAIDLVNRINTAVQGRIITAATAYSAGAAYKAAAGGGITAPNDWDAISAMAAQVENATFSNSANVAVTSTNKKWILGTMKDNEGRWLGVPEIARGLSLASNPSYGNDNVLVGDLKQYNIALRGGIIVRVGYNGIDFANNMFSTVTEQFYFDYISDARKPAIVKGPDFATVKAAIAA